MKNGKTKRIMKTTIEAYGRKEGRGFQIFNGFPHAVVAVFYKPTRAKKSRATYKAVAAAFFLALAVAPTAHAQVSGPMAVRAIVGESAGEGYRCMLAHAHAIRNRGTLHGVYGFYAKHSASEPTRVWAAARRAWLFSAGGTDITKGASYFFSEEDLRRLEVFKPAWFMRLRKTVKIGSVTFFKEPRERRR